MWNSGARRVLPTGSDSRTIRSSTPTGTPTEPGRRGSDSGCAVIWLAASVIP